MPLSVGEQETKIGFWVEEKFYCEIAASKGLLSEKRVPAFPSCYGPARE